MKIKTNVSGPAPLLTIDQTDIIDEAIEFFRLNVHMKNFQIHNREDKALLYLSVYIGHILKMVAGW